VIHVDPGVRPDRNGSEGAPVSRPQEDHGAPHTPEHDALKRKPALAERLGCGRLGELAPQFAVQVSSSWAI
jgi:hypothetical protein